MRPLSIRPFISHNLFLNKTQSICQFGAKKYILSQFPYPSGELHLGHARVYYIGDTLARYYKLQGNQVIYPIGWDSFGLPAENAAILHGKNPLQWTQNNIQQMKAQLNCLSIDFDWDREISTSRPNYYKWTQQIFIHMFNKGLAYRDLCQVNWDPIDKTVLANEQVDKEGRSWRSGAIVQKKMLEQWFFKITHYAKQLQQGLSNLNWIERVKGMQAGWIGYRKGYFLTFRIKKIEQKNMQKLGLTGNIEIDKEIKVFTSDLNLLNDQNSYIRLNISHKDTEHPYQFQEVLVGEAFNPLSGSSIKIITGNEQNGAILQLITHQKQISTDKMVDKQQIEKVMKMQQSQIMRIRDWSVSRQRYWGTPIPIIYCLKCGIVPVPDEQLPVLLPQWIGDGNPLLQQEFKKCKCPKCGGNAQRETDTMDTFVDSSWYFLRFLDPHNTKQLCSAQLANKMMPVDIYIGGIEHAIMHLLYARFFMRFLSDQKVCDVKQPFKELVVQGLVKGKTLRHKRTGKYIKPSQKNNYPAQQVDQTYEKMSKSKFNGLNPTQLVETYGADQLRIALFFAAPPEHDVDFSEELLVSAGRFLRRVEDLFTHVKTNFNNNQYIDNIDPIQELLKNEDELCFKLKTILQKIDQGMEKRFMHVYVANCMELFNLVKNFIQTSKQKKQINTILFGILTPILEIIAPQTITKIKQENLSAKCIDELSWPKATLFSQQSEYQIMKGGKLFKKGRMPISQQMSDQQIYRMVGVDDGEKMVKRNKKGIVIIIK